MDGQLRITEMFAYVAVDNDGTEGVVAFPTNDGWMPMVGADTDRTESLRPLAQGIANQLGKPVELIRFTVRERVELIECDPGVQTGANTD